MTGDDERVVVGVVTKPHGIRGAVIVRPTTDTPRDRFSVGSVLASDAPGAAELTIAFSDVGSSGVRIRFAEITDRTAAESLRGAQLTIGRQQRRDLDREEFWPSDLVGCTVEAVTGEALGVVKDVEFGAAQDRLVIETVDGSVAVLPFVAPLVPEIDLDNRRIIIDPPGGWISGSS